MAGDSVVDAAVIEVGESCRVDCSLSWLDGWAECLPHYITSTAEGTLQKFVGYSNLVSLAVTSTVDSTLPKLTSYSSVEALTGSNVNSTLPALVGHSNLVSMVVTSTVDSTLPKLTSYSSVEALTGSNVNSTLPALVGHSNLVSMVVTSTVDITLPALRGESAFTLPYTGSARTRFSPLTSFSRAGSACRVDSTLESLSGWAFQTLVSGVECSLEPLTGRARTSDPPRLIAVASGVLPMLVGASRWLTGEIASVDAATAGFDTYASERASALAWGFVGPLLGDATIDSGIEFCECLERAWFGSESYVDYHYIPKVYEDLTITAPTAARVDLSALSADQLNLNDTIYTVLVQLLSESISLMDLTGENIRRLVLVSEALLVWTATAATLTTTSAARESLELSDALHTISKLLLGESFTLADDAYTYSKFIARLREVVELADAQSTYIEVSATASDILEITDVLKSITKILLGESFTLSADTFTYSKFIAHIREVLELAASQDIHLEVFTTASENVVLSDAITNLIKIILGESFTLNDASLIYHKIIARLKEVLSLAAAPSTHLEVFSTAEDTLILKDVLKSLSQFLLGESFTLSDDAFSYRKFISRLREILAVADSQDIQLEVFTTALEALTLTDAIKILARWTLGETLSFSEQSAALRALRMQLGTSVALRSETVSTVMIAQSLLETLVAVDVAAFVRQASASEVLALTDALQMAIRTSLHAPETLNVLDEISSSLVVLRTASEDVAFEGLTASTLVMSLLAGERLAFIGRLVLGEEAFSAWVLNTDTLGSTSYSQFPMLAMTTHQGRTFGITETGLYELTGETDDGESIQAVIETGDLSFALHADKSIPRAYLYLWTDGVMRLRTVSSQRGCRSEAWYNINFMSGDDEQARIVQLARGVRGTTWQFQIENVAGCDFDLRGAEVLPVVLNKRGARS